MVAQSRVTSAALALTLLVVPPAWAAGPDGDVEWDGLFSDTTDQFVSPRRFAPGDRVTLSLRAYANDLTAARCLVFFSSGASSQVAMSKAPASGAAGFDLWRCAVDVPANAGELYYRFEVTDGADTDYYDAGAPGDPWNIRGVQDEQRSFFDFRLYADFSVPEWAEGAIFYQIFPDRFANGVPANDRVYPDDCFWYLDYAPASPEAAACAAYQVPPAPAGQSKRCLVQGDWHAEPNGGPCDFFGGDLVGIDQRLEYLEDLGATALYLNPIFKSPSNHKYDTLSYTEVDPRFGTLGELERLSKDVHRRDMRIIVDGVFNHVSDLGEHYNLWSNYAFDPGARSAAGVDGFEATCGAWEDVFLGQSAPGQRCQSTYADWFRLWVAQDVWDVDRDGDRDEPNAHTCGWAGLGFMPEIDFKNPGQSPNSGPRVWLYGGTSASDLSAARRSTAARWLVDGEVLAEGLDGWRLDVPDNAGFFTQPSGCDKAAADPTIWQGFRQAVKAAGEDKYISGEIWTDAAEVGGAAGDWFRARTYDAVMNYHFFGTPVSCLLTGKGVHNDAGECAGPYEAMRAGNPGALSALVSHLAESRRKYPAGAYLSNQNLISSHDSARFASRAGGGADAIALMRLVTAMQVTLPGAAMIYYGDELATPGANNELGRATFDWDLFADPAGPRVQLREEVRKLACARNNLPALRTGSLISLVVDDAQGVWAFARFTAEAPVVVVLNTSGAERTVEVPVARAGVAAGTLVDVLTGAEHSLSAGRVRLTVPARGSVLLAPAAAASAAERCRTPNRPPVAKAGEDARLTVGAGLRLDATASEDPDGRPLSYRWTDGAGAGVGRAPTLDLSLPVGVHTFVVEVSDGVYTARDEVVITVDAAPDPTDPDPKDPDPNDPDPNDPDPNDPDPNDPDPVGQNPGTGSPAPGGCVCAAPSPGGAAPSLWALLVAGALLAPRRRRR
jgi:alpha-glucosidase